MKKLQKGENIMEELKNNETSEKKERIEPLEVITLEGDAIPAEGEATDSPCVRRGNLYKKDTFNKTGYRHH